MGQKTLVREEIDAGAELVRKFNEYAPVCAAFWMRMDEDSPQYLYISSEKFSEGSIKSALRELSRIADEMHNPNLSVYRVRVLRPDDPMIRDVRAVYNRYPGSTVAIHFDGNYLGNTPVDDAYIYPQISSNTNGSH
jgi:hypothetical protein